MPHLTPKAKLGASDVYFRHPPKGPDSGPVRDVARDVNVIFYLMVIALTLLVLAVKTWGLVVLTIVALCMVPMMFALFIWISWP